MSSEIWHRKSLNNKFYMGFVHRRLLARTIPILEAILKYGIRLGDSVA